MSLRREKSTSQRYSEPIDLKTLTVTEIWQTSKKLRNPYRKCGLGAISHEQELETRPMTPEFVRIVQSRANYMENKSLEFLELRTAYQVLALLRSSHGADKFPIKVGDNNSASLICVLFRLVPFSFDEKFYIFLSESPQVSTVEEAARLEFMRSAVVTKSVKASMLFKILLSFKSFLDVNVGSGSHGGIEHALTALRWKAEGV